MPTAEKSVVDISADIVRVYLKDVSRIPVMTPAEERTIAGEIVTAEGEQRRVLFSIPQIIDELYRIKVQLEDGSLRVSDVVRNAGMPVLSEGEESPFLNRAIASIHEMSLLHSSLERTDAALLRAERGDILALRAEQQRQKKELQDRVSGFNVTSDLLEQIVQNIARRLKTLTGARRRRLLDSLYELREIDDRIRSRKTRLIQGNMRLVVTLARKYQGRGLDLMDLIQEGNIGLMRAADKYDYQKGCRFTTYASWWIRQTMIRALSNASNIIKIPINIIEDKTRIGGIAARLLQELEREPELHEISARSGFSQQKIADVMAVPEPAVSLEAIVGENEATLGDFVADHNGRCALQELVNASLKEQMGKVLSTLTKREETVIRMRFGFNRTEGCTLGEIGDNLRVTREYVRQIELKALRRLKHPVRKGVLEIFQE